MVAGINPEHTEDGALSEFCADTGLYSADYA
jgi:hypothetical protein